MNRRIFLSTLAAVLSGATLDPERLLWRPGAKTIFLPAAVKPLVFESLAFASTFPALVSDGWSPTGILQIGDKFTVEGFSQTKRPPFVPVEWITVNG